MPPMETSERHQKATLWMPGPVNRYGELTALTPREIMVRWENKTSQMIDPQGEEVTVDAMVVVAEDLPIGAILWLGALADWPGTGLGKTVGGVSRVIATKNTPDVKGRAFRKVCGVKKYKDDPNV